MTERNLPSTNISFSPAPASPWFDRHALLVGAILLIFATLISSGRVSSGDTGAQLQAATLLAREGRLGSDVAPDFLSGLWVQSPSGKFYQCHDLGSQLLLLPAGFLGRQMDPMHGTRLPLAARALAGYTYSLVGALTLFMFYQTLRSFYPRNTAFVLTMVFAASTIYVAYMKTAWDVSAGALGIAGVCCLLSRGIVSQSLPWSRAIGLAFWTAFACWFRFSLIPFVGLALVMLAWTQRRNWPLWRSLVAGAVFGILMVGPLIFNHVRMGSPFRPATTAAQYAEVNSLTGNTLLGLLGLIASPNKGLVWNTPAFLLFLTLPWTYRQHSITLRQLLWPLLVGAGLYMAMIGTMRNWGSFGWGARYVVPVLPILGIQLVSLILLISRSRPKLAWTLVAVGVLSNSIAVVTNYHLAAVAQPDSWDAGKLYPAQQIATWHAAWQGLHGASLETDAARSANAQFGEFPDFMIARLAEHSTAGMVAATGLGLTGIAALIVLTRLVLRKDGIDPSVLQWEATSA